MYGTNLITYLPVGVTIKVCLQWYTHWGVYVHNVITFRLSRNPNFVPLSVQYQFLPNRCGVPDQTIPYLGVTDCMMS
jgi:hypothetical protein